MSIVAPFPGLSPQEFNEGLPVEISFATCRYFQCEPKYGLFAPLPKVEKLASAADEGQSLL